MAKRTKRKSPSIGWHKSDSQTRRRRSVLSQCKGDYLHAARLCQQIANRHSDYDTRRKARMDAKYFFAKYKRKKK